MDWYRPIHENAFLSSFHFHFFELEEASNLEGSQNDNISDEAECLNSMPIDLIKSVIKRFGGTISDTIDPQTTHIITQFQCDHLLPTQLLGPVQFVTLSWLLKGLSAGKCFDPDEAIDFPCPIHPIPGSSALVQFHW